MKKIWLASLLTVALAFSCKPSYWIVDSIKHIQKGDWDVIEFNENDSANGVTATFYTRHSLPNATRLEWTIPEDLKGVLTVKGDEVQVIRPIGKNETFTFTYVILDSENNRSEPLTIDITVLGIDVLVTDIIAPSSITLVLDQRRDLPEVSVLPANASLKTLDWVPLGNMALYLDISNSSITAESGVNTTGQLKVAATDGSGIFKIIQVNIVENQVMPTKVRVLPEIDHLEVGESKQIYGKVYPADYNNGKASYKIISGGTLATIDEETGKLKAGGTTGTVVVQYGVEGEGVNISPVTSTIHIVNKITDVSNANYDSAKDVTMLDLDRAFSHQKIIDRAPGGYKGHPSSTMTPEGKLIILYPASHGIGAINMITSDDHGESWKRQTNIPAQWAYSAETPTVFRLDLTNGEYRYLQTSSHPHRTGGDEAACQETTGFDWSFSYDGVNWEGFFHKDTIFNGIKFGNTVGFADVIQLKDQKTGEFIDKWMGIAHDDNSGGLGWSNYLMTFSFEGGYDKENILWDAPYRFTNKNGQRLRDDTNQLCEVGFIRSPDHTTIAALFRNQTHNNQGSFISFSNDEGKSWSELKQMPSVLDGERHQGAYFKDGRLIIMFREMILRQGTTWVVGEVSSWIGTFLDLQKGGAGQYLICLKRDYTPNARSGDAGYPTLDLFDDGSMFMTSYGVYDTDGTLSWMSKYFGTTSALKESLDWTKSAAGTTFNSTLKWSPYIMSFRYKPSDFDTYARKNLTYNSTNNVVEPGKVSFDASWRKFPKGPSHASVLPEERCSGNNSCTIHLGDSRPNQHSMQN